MRRLLVVFISMVTHLTCAPYNVRSDSGRMLHYVEFAALSVTFVTFWGGMIFYLDSDIVDGNARVFMTTLIVSGNVVFVVAALCLYLKQVVKDTRQNEVKQSHGTGSRKLDDDKHEGCENASSVVQVVPAGGNAHQQYGPQGEPFGAEHLKHAEAA